MLNPNNPKPVKYGHLSQWTDTAWKSLIESVAKGSSPIELEKFRLEN